MAALLEAIAKFFANGAGSTVGTVLTFGGILASLTPLLTMLFKERNEIITTITVGDASVYGVVLACMLGVAYLTRRGG